METQKSIGQPIGKITEVNRTYFKTDCADLSNGDGLCYFTKQRELTGFRVDRVDHGRVYPKSLEGLETGTFLYRNFDIVFDRLLKKTSAFRKIDIKMNFTQEKDRICLVAVDEDGNRAEKWMDVPYEQAKDSSKVFEQIKKQLSRTGDTIYHVTDINVSPAEPGFIVISTLNNLRRECLNELTKIRLEKYPFKKSVFVPNDIPYPIKQLDYHANVLNKKARQFYARHGTEVLEPAFETSLKILGRQVMTSKYCIRRELNACLKSENPQLQLKGPLHIRDERYIYQLEFDCRNCRMSVVFEGKY